MNIKFTSVIDQNNKKNKIEFSAPVQITKENNFKVFEFEEPSQKVMNRIEFSKKHINIFAGSSSINLTKNQKNRIEYATPHGNIFLTSFLYKVDVSKKNIINFEYSLSSADEKEIIGLYNITLTLKKH